jgi:MoxR-like ATPase
MIIEQSEHIMNEVKKVFIGKDEIIEKVLMTIYAGGHILLEDAPGVGKTTLALGFSRALGLSYKRIQFTPDTMPSDITGFSIYNKQTGNFEYKPGAADCHLLLGDEINRTSPKTQAALLEVMEEGSVTVDGETHVLPKPFICIATQNHYGSAGTQALPESQLDRFMVRLSIGYPDRDSQVAILKQRRGISDMDQVQAMMNRDDVKEIQDYLYSIHMTDDILYYISELCEETRKNNMVELGVSPRGVRALSQLARARAMLKERDYVIPEDVQNIFLDVCAHRLTMKPQAKISGVSAESVLRDILRCVKAPSLDRR